MLAKDNPYRTDQVLKIRYHFPEEGSMEELLNNFRQLNYCAAIVGPEGSGKTTLMEDVGRRLKEVGFHPQEVSLTREFPQWPVGRMLEFCRNLSKQDVVLFDGAELMGTLQWKVFKFLARKAGGLLITLHQPGRLPTLMQCSTSPGLLSKLIHELSRYSGPPDLHHVMELHHRHRGNLREALREMYDLHAARTGKNG